MRKCNKCKLDETQTEFYDSENCKYKCKPCIKKENKERWQKFKLDPVLMQAKRDRNKMHRNAKREEIKIKRKERQKRKYKENELFKIQVLLRSAFYKAIKRGQGVKQKSIMKMIGCTQQELRDYLESKFKPEMNWKNHGKVWEIDHIVPIDSFDLTRLEEQEKCFHYTNTQPLFKTTAIAKSFGYNEIGNQNKSNKVHVS